MGDLMDWLIEIEKETARVYEEAARFFSSDREFSSFLLRLADDEHEHHKSLVKAASILKEAGEGLPGAVYLDEDSRKKAEEVLKKAASGLKNGGMTRAAMIDALVEIEFSERNDFFLFIMNTLKGKGKDKEFIPDVADVQRHKRGIEAFLRARPAYAGQLERVARLPDVSEDRILVVDDDAAVANVIAAILEDVGEVERVSNAKDALKRLDERHYSVIVSDIGLPVMSGMEFYRKAAEKYPDTKGRFVFFTGSFNEKRSDFFKESGVKVLRKPFQIKDMKDAVIEALKR